MERSWKYCLSLFAILLVFSSCVELSNETYYHLDWDERRKLSADYTQLAKRMQRGSPKNMRLLEKAVVIDPKNDLAWRELSLPYLYAGMIKEWNENMSNAVDLNAEAWQAWRGYQKLYFFRDYSGALFDFDATDTLTWDKTDYPQNISVDYLRGLCYLGLEQYDESTRYFNKYIADESEKVGEKYVDETAFLYLGIICNYQSKYKEAIKYFNRAVEFEKGVADVDYHKAQALLNIGKHSEAEELLLNAKKKFEDDERMRGWYYETIEELSINDFATLEASIKSKIE